MAKADQDRPIALTIGEPAGIGPEILIAAWRQQKSTSVPAFYCLGDANLLRRRSQLLGSPVPIKLAGGGDDIAAIFAEALPVVPLSGSMTAAPASPETTDVPLIIEAVDRAVDDVRQGKAAAVVTNPVNKLALRRGGFAYPGHTEYLGHLAERWTGQPAHPVMMIAGPNLRTVPVTIHVPLADVPRILNEDMIVETGRIVAADLESRFGVARPRIAVAGLNPHAGEHGTIGAEDDAIVRPAVERMRSLGINATGPLPADTMFHATARATYDAALCMYHDQALIPAKTLAFDEAVNVTLGLPFVRTSPDHGTAFDIAGSGRANPSSLIAALRLAAAMARAETSR
jgi:4-hydroxythreonine-4-phosphate dehydrogenase